MPYFESSKRYGTGVVAPAETSGRFVCAQRKVPVPSSEVDGFTFLLEYTHVANHSQLQITQQNNALACLNHIYFRRQRGNLPRAIYNTVVPR